MSKEYKANIEIGGKTYPCEVKDGVRLIDGKTIEEFFNTLTRDEVHDLAVIGRRALYLEALGRVTSRNELQRHANALHSRRVN